MNHLDEGQLQAYIDDELSSDECASVDCHLRECLSCRAELRDLRSLASELTSALAILDRPTPVVTSVGGGARVARPSVWRGRLAALPRAAVLVFGVAVGASAMIPGSPLHRLITSEPAPQGPVDVPRQEVAARTTAAVEEFVPEAGVSIEPLDGAVRVVLRGASPDVRVNASLSAAGRASVLARGPAAAARFETAPGRIVVEGAEAGELRIELPLAATVATVEVNGREYLRKVGEQLHLLVPAHDRNGTEVIFHP
jgi:hypothetical protein